MRFCILTSVPGKFGEDKQEFSCVFPPPTLSPHIRAPSYVSALSRKIFQKHTSLVSTILLILVLSFASRSCSNKYPLSRGPVHQNICQWLYQVPSVSARTTHTILICLILFSYHICSTPPLPPSTLHSAGRCWPSTITLHHHDQLTVVGAFVILKLERNWSISRCRYVLGEILRFRCWRWDKLKITVLTIGKYRATRTFRLLLHTTLKSD